MKASCGLRIVAVVVVFAMPKASHASMFGEENATLGAILTQVTNSASGIRQNFDELRRTTQLASETASFAREMVQVGKNMHTIIENPAEFAAYMTRSWYRAYPELYGSLADIYSVRESIYQASHPEDMLQYDAYAYVRAFDRMASSTDNGFEVWAHAVDRWGINKPHDDAIRGISEQRRIAVENLAKVAGVINASGLSPAQASIYTAQSSAVSAVAQAEAAASLSSLVRTTSLAITSMAHGSANANAELSQHGDFRVRTEDWDLDPMRGRRTLTW